MEQPSDTKTRRLGITLFLGMLLVQGFHELEHICQVFQHDVFHNPLGAGLLGTWIDIEPVHFVYNGIFLILLALVYSLIGCLDKHDRPRTSVFLLLTFALLFQTYHFVEHVFKIQQFFDTGMNGTPGILGSRFRLVWLHFTYNTAEFIPILLAFFLGGYHRRIPVLLPSRRVRWVTVSALTPVFVVFGMAFNAGFRQSACPFDEVAASAGVDFKHTRDDRPFHLGGGAAVGDFNNDGLLDIYAVNSEGKNALYRNDGGWKFTDVAEAVGLAGPIQSGNGAGWADYDNDGDLDIFVAAYGRSRLFRNEGAPAFKFTDVTRAAGVADSDITFRTMGVSWGDYDGDGFLDLVVVRHFSDHNMELFFPELRLNEASRPLALYHNEGNGAFKDTTTMLGDPTRYPGNVNTAGFKVAFIDIDNDGDADIYSINDFGRESFPNVLWRNDGPDGEGGWKFTDISASARVNVRGFLMGLAVGDYDNDRDLDLYITDMGPSLLLRNEGKATFSQQQKNAGVGRGMIPGVKVKGMNVGWGAAFLDCDNDGWLDLYMVAGFLDNDPLSNQAKQPDALFLNKRDGTFKNISYTSGVADPSAGREIAVADFDNDGRLDVFVLNVGIQGKGPAVARLYRSRADPDQRWLAVKPVGTVSNRDAVGARVYVTAGGMTQMREIGSSEGHTAHNATPAYFGLGSAREVAKLEVRWPSGKTLTLTGVQPDQTLVLTEPTEG